MISLPMSNEEALPAYGNSQSTLHVVEGPTQSEDPTTSTIVPCQTLLLDNNLVYNSEPPSQALYEVSKTDGIPHVRNTYSVYRIDGPRADGANEYTKYPRDRKIYEFTIYVITVKHIYMEGHRKGTFSKGGLRLRRHLSLTGCYWSVKHTSWGSSRILLRCNYKPFAKVFGGTYHWIDKAGHEVAVERSLKSGKNVIPSLQILTPLEQRELDLIVAVWTARAKFGA